MTPPNPYEDYIHRLSGLIAEARAFPLGVAPDYALPARRAGAPVALIFSPHPDDEVIIGGWALRLLRQSGWRVINIAVTLGNNKARQAPRWAELQACCRCIGFELEAAAPDGLAGVRPHVRADEPGRWRTMVEIIAAILTAHRPRAIFYPHEKDWHATHVGTHYLATDALALMPRDFHVATIETEFWAQMPKPNALVESSASDVAALVTALTFHVGEVQRNPYHLTLPAWMMDNVRRGGEWVGGVGQGAPSFQFGTLYRLRQWTSGAFDDVSIPNGFLDAGHDTGDLLLS